MRRRRAALRLQWHWRILQLLRHLAGVPHETRRHAADKIQAEWRVCYARWFVHEYYDPWGRFHRVPAGTPVPNFQMSAIKIQWAYWRFYDRHESAWLIQAAWRAWPGPLIPSWFWATNKTNNINICEESTDALAGVPF